MEEFQKRSLIWRKWLWGAIWDFWVWALYKIQVAIYYKYLKYGLQLGWDYDVGDVEIINLLWL